MNGNKEVFNGLQKSFVCCFDGFCGISHSWNYFGKANATGRYSENHRLLYCVQHIFSSIATAGHGLGV
ncbi:MAG: hypothetical protein J6R96_08280 [Spirochaetaceae bacterium]|nr:hypothetical protein [Spirochaetaceae bacterium]